MSVALKDLHNFLDSNSTESKFYIEYSGFLSNHLGHAAIALYKLGDEKDHFSAYLVDHYSTKLEATDGKTCQSQQADDEESVEGLLGQRRGYYKVPCMRTSEHTE